MGKKNWDVMAPNGQAGRGRLNFRLFEKWERPSFVDYLRSGWQIGLTLAIDYTASNGNPSQPNSLHFLGGQNQYEAAIAQVGSILEPYDQARMFATFGFGGIPRHMGLNSVSHCFPVNGSPADPRIQGVGGVLQAYRGTLPQIGLGGPTNFENVLRTFTQHAEANAGFQQYQILLIITDGMITDM